MLCRLSLILPHRIIMIRNISRSIISALLILSVVFCSGCATIIKGSNEKIYVDCTNGIAKVYLDGFLVGTTPLVLDLPTKNTYRLEVRMNGHEEQGKLLSSRIDESWVIVDIMLGFVPVLIDAANGTLYTFDETRHTFTLTEKRE